MTARLERHKRRCIGRRLTAIRQRRRLRVRPAKLRVKTFADDPIVSPQLGIAQEEISRTPSGRHVLIRASEKSLGRLSIYAPDVWKVIVPSLLEVDESR